MASRVVEQADRFFFLVWLGIYALLPTSGWSDVMFRSWYDQRLYLNALRETLAGGTSAAVTDNIVGPAYIAIARLAHTIPGLTPQDALVLVSRMSYALSVAGALVLVRIGIRTLAGVPPLVTLAGQFALAALCFAAGTWYWSDVPWTHFLTTALAVGILVARFAWTDSRPLRAMVIGALIALLALTRTFEFAALMGAWAIAALVLAPLPGGEALRLRARNLVSGAASFLVVVVAVYAATGKRGFFVLYGSNLDQLSANVDDNQIASTPTFSFDLFPTKLVQIFVEPCFRAVCSIADYQNPGSQLLPLNVAEAGNYRLWSQPLLVQMPSLVLLPACIAVCLALVARAYRNRVHGSPRRMLRLPLELTIAATGLVVGYTANTLSGSPHLRYGLVRDFMLPAILTGIVAVSFVSAGLWLILARRGGERRFSPGFSFVMTALVGSACAVAVLAYARANGIPRIEGSHLGAVTYTATCRDHTCHVSIDAETSSGRAISIPQASVLTFGCGSDTARFSVYSAAPKDGVRIEGDCANARLVAAWPTVMGLPPGSFELRAVGVRNA